jgi:hypothetical protein
MINRVSKRSAAPAATNVTAPKPRAANTRPFTLEPSQAAPPPKPSGEQPSALGGAIRTTMNSLEKQRNDIDRVVRQAARGATFSPAELLVLQSRVYAYSRELEVVSRLVDRTVSSVKTTLNTQV